MLQGASVGSAYVTPAQPVQARVLQELPLSPVQFLVLSSELQVCSLKGFCAARQHHALITHTLTLITDVKLTWQNADCRLKPVRVYLSGSVLCTPQGVNIPGT